MSPAPSVRPSSRSPVFGKLAKFLVAGLPAFLVALPLNLFLVENLAWPKTTAYATVLVVQVTINFFACTLWVFERDRRRKLLSQFALFMSGILLARALDWGLYSLLVKITPIHYVAIQVFNVILFSLAKFAFARRAIEGRRKGRRPGARPS